MADDKLPPPKRPPDLPPRESESLQYWTPPKPADRGNRSYSIVQGCLITLAVMVVLIGVLFGTCVLMMSRH